MAAGGSPFPAPRPIDRRIAIAVLTHADLGFDPGTTLARIALEHWAPAGHRILPHRGLGPPPPADLAILHIGYTVTPEPYLELAARYPRTVNAAVTDTLKRSVCTDLVGPDDGYDGPVIVKTDLNHAGKPEARRRWRDAGSLKRMWLRLERQLPARWFGQLKGNRYRVVKRKSAVPGWVWRAPGLVVQPLHTERHGDLYAINQWYFFGDRDCMSTMLGRRPVVKLANTVERLPLHCDVPEELRRRRAELKFDYGKFDFVMENGAPILLDANSTPHEGRDFPTPPREVAICAALADGLGAYLA